MKSLSLLPEVLPDNIIEDIKIMALSLRRLVRTSKHEKDIRRSQIRWIDPRTEDTVKLTNLCTNLFVDINREHFVDIPNIQYSIYRILSN